jgi:hypothetical protein
MRDSVRGQWRSGLGLFKDPAPPKSGRVSCARARARVYALVHMPQVHIRARETRPFRVRSGSDFSTPCTHTASRPLPTGHRGCTLASTTGVQLLRVCSNPRRSPAPHPVRPSSFLRESTTREAPPTRVTMVRLSPHFLGFRRVGGDDAVKYYGGGPNRGQRRFRAERIRLPSRRHNATRIKSVGPHGCLSAEADARDAS